MSSLRELAEDAGRDKIIKIPKIKKIKIPGFDYVSSLELYVSRSIIKRGKGLSQIYKGLKEKGSKMLTLPMWWKYYDHIVKEKISLPQGEITEFIDGMVIGKDYVEFSDDKLLGGYKKVVPDGAAIIQISLMRTNSLNGTKSSFIYKIT